MSETFKTTDSHVWCPICAAPYSRMDDPEEFQRIARDRDTLEHRATKLEGVLRSSVSAIDQFEAKCDKADKTDTGDVWDLLYKIREDANKAVGA